jgi:exosortase K
VVSRVTQNTLQHTAIPSQGRLGEIIEFQLVDFGTGRKPRFSPGPDAKGTDRLLHQPVKQRQCWRSTLAWWSLAAGLAAALKACFSAAAASELEWMLRPVSLLLRIVAGWKFQQNDAGEWYSLEAGIVLVKACAGINFMIMSLLGWCWLARPRYTTRLQHATFEWPLLLGSSLVFAWAAALFVNTLRILAIVQLQPTLEHWLLPDDAHRLLGLVVYVAALNLQLLVFDTRRWKAALLVACALYASIMLVVPLLTGNASANPALYLRHALTSLGVLLPFAGLACFHWWRGYASRDRL